MLGAPPPEALRRELGFAGSDERRFSFHVDPGSPTAPFIFQYQQGNNHWESGARTATLQDIRADWPSFVTELLRCNCAWALPVFEEGFRSMDTRITIEKLIEWSDGFRDVQHER